MDSRNHCSIHLRDRIVFSVWFVNMRRRRCCNWNRSSSVNLSDCPQYRKQDRTMCSMLRHIQDAIRIISKCTTPAQSKWIWFWMLFSIWLIITSQIKRWHSQPISMNVFQVYWIRVNDEKINKLNGIWNKILIVNSIGGALQIGIHLLYNIG